MEIRYLKYFVAVVEKRSFTKAAEQLHISQPSLSSAIKNMEKSLDLKLIERSTKGIRLTEEGELLYEEAKKLVRHHENVFYEMEQVKRRGVGELSIGLIESSMLWVPDLLNQFRVNFPHVKVKLLEVLSLEEVEEALWNYEIHLAITNQFLHRDEVETAPVYRERLVGLFPPEHPLTEKPYIELLDLAEEPFIVSREGFQTREDILNAFRKVGIVPNIQFEIERFETATRLVEKNLGVTIIPENYVKYAKHLSANARPIQDFPLFRTVYLAYEKNRSLPPTAVSFIDFVKNYFEKE